MLELVVILLYHLSGIWAEGENWLMWVEPEMKENICTRISAWQKKNRVVSKTHLQSKPESFVLWAISEPEVAVRSSLSYQRCLGPSEIPHKQISQSLKLQQHTLKLSQMNVYFTLSYILLGKDSMKLRRKVLNQVSTTALFRNFCERLD